MKQFSAGFLKAGLNAIYYTGAHHVARPFWGGLGAILMLHHVTPDAAVDRASRFAPNGGLSITPEFLDHTLSWIKDEGLECIPLDEAPRRLREGASDKRFICFTLDDGYQDNHQYARPVFERHKIPYTVYITNCLPDGTAELWWIILERLIAGQRHINIDHGPLRFSQSCASTIEKYNLFSKIYWILRQLPEGGMRRLVLDFGRDYGIDPEALCRDLAMSWDQIREVDQSEFGDIGSHTHNHYALAGLDQAQAAREIGTGKTELERELGREVHHFSYPYGDENSAGPRDFKLAEEAGFITATTTRKGLLYSEHKGHMLALPRISINGNYQNIRFIKLLLSGAPFMLFNKFRKLNVA